MDRNRIETTRKKVELLAPAGNPEGFYGAIHAGAEAVYLAGDRFGARAYADNFTTEELVACIRYAHIWGRKVYLTVNTLVKESELAELHPFLTPFYEAGLDGVIIQDIGVFCYIREHFPNLELHVSTQMTLTSGYGGKLLKQMGANRIVPARELSLEEIKLLKSETGLEIECFIHGAMCYCYSGQCLFSSILGGRSGNRGKCAQPCRLPYAVEIDGKTSAESYPLSLKDMCTIEHIPDLIHAGIDSFKIEGRMKKPEYAAGVTAIYRKYIDRYYLGEDCTVSGEDLRKLSELYIRSERQDGYYYRHNGADMVTLHNPSYGNTNESLNAAIRAEYIEQAKKIPVMVQAEFQTGKPARLTWIVNAERDDLQITVTGDQVAPAQKMPITKENIQKQLGKLGDTVFTVSKMDISLDPDCFYSLKALNELRRTAVRQMEDRLIVRHGLCVGRKTESEQTNRRNDSGLLKSKNRKTGQSMLHVLVHSPEQLAGVLDVLDSENIPENSSDAKMHYPVGRIYLEGDLASRIYTEDTQRELRTRLEAFLSRQSNCELMIALPQIIRQRDVDYLKTLSGIALQHNEIKGFLVRSMDGMGYLTAQMQPADERFQIYTDAGFYTWNADSLYAVPADGFCLPYELKAADQHRLLEQAGDANAEKIVYGYIPLMHTANCVFRTLNGCRKSPEEGTAYLTDRYRKKFPVVRNCTHCINIIYNCLPLSLHGELMKWQGTVDFRVDFTLEDKAQTMRVLRYFMTGCAGNRPYAEFTGGHEKRGAE
ncbi:MAG: U32 family peptidase [Lachnospiraceae bacterium]|nr:U32 family peptidase [Lachnospiraceae bacterium]